LNRKEGSIGFLAALADRRWWIEHGIETLTLLFTIVLAFLIHSLDLNDRRHDSEQQGAMQAEQTQALQRINKSEQLAVSQARAENDFHQAFAFFSSLEQFDEPGQVVQRRRMSHVIEQYSLQGRLYQPAADIFVDDLSKECDSEIYQALRNAVETSQNVVRPDVTSEDDRKKDKAARTDLRLKIQTALQAHTNQCTDHAEAPGKSANRGPFSRDYPLGSINVDCGGVATGPRQLSADLPPGYSIASLGATVVDTSNLKSASASALISDEKTITVNFRLEGLDFQTLPFGLRNCPGGGHGTVVVRAMLVPKQ
jgi:hypothetical protein